MTALRDYLADELAKKVERNGVVIWDDPEGAYSGVVAEITPADSALYSFDGSWFALRKAVEGKLAGPTPPSLLVYVGTGAPDPDPLEELRAVGSKYRITMPTLLKNALAGQLSEQRIGQISKQCTTIAEAEAAVQGADSSVDARLIAVVGDSSERLIAAGLIAGVHAEEVESRDLADAVRSTLASSLGGDFTGLSGDELRQAAFRQIVLAALHSSVGSVPSELAGTFSEPTPAQAKTCHAVLDTLQTDRSLRAGYIALAEAVDGQLALASNVDWTDGLVAVDASPAFEKIALAECARLLDVGDFGTALNLARQRAADSWWARSEAPSGNAAAAQYRAVAALGQLGLGISREVPALTSVADLMHWYTEHGWRADSAFREAEYARVTSGASLDRLDDIYHDLRGRYETWLDEVLSASSDAMQNVDVDPSRMQRSIHSRHVAKSTGPTAYILVDALRYELGRDLADRLATVNAEVSLDAALGTAPSITPVGMAAVLPGADLAFEVDLTDADRLHVKVGGHSMKGVPDRVKRIEHAHGKVVDIELDRLAQISNKELKRKIANATLVLVRSTEIDTDGESDQLAASWGSFDTTLNVLHTAVARLLTAGIGRVVITSDHGFLAVRRLGAHRRIDKPPTGHGELHRRAWIGKGGKATESTVKVPLASFGVSGGLDIITPRGLGVFTSGGGLQFFHGGLSPQELIVPVITIVAEEATPAPKYNIHLEVAGERITTGVIVVTIAMSGDLFTRESAVRLDLTQDGDRAAIVVAGAGFDHTTETIDASVDTVRTVTMKVMTTLRAGTTARLEVLDAATGIQLSTRDVEVAADVIVEEELD